MSGAPITISPTARQTYLAIYSICRASASKAARRHESSTSGQFRRSDFSGQGFTGYYEAGQPTAGPLGDASAYGAPRITPKVLKHHLDQYVIGQERAKKVLSVAVYNHYQRIQEIQRQQEEEEELLAQQERRAIAGKHPVESEFPGQQTTTTSVLPDADPLAALDHDPLQIDKSNVLLLGPSGVGKSLMTKTLARVLEVPFSTSDCTPFTQAGYIGEDADVCVQRLLAAANYDVAAAERGIICLDEIDKIATAKVSHGKDVSGEGVQQALLKIIEGTTIQVQAKQERSSGGAAPSSPSGGGRQPNSVPTGSINQSPPPSKGDVYNVDTSNILFICTGAFVGLHKLIMDRLAKGSIGFGATLASPARPDTTDPSVARTKANDDLFRKHLPFYTRPADTFAPAATNPSATPSSSPSQSKPDDDADPPTYNTLDLATPSDLQKYGLIPELVGRIPVTCSLTPLSLAALVRVLTEPRHALVAQYTQLFALSGLELAFTTPALREVARAALGMGTGARGLRTVLERLLGDAMFEAPGSGSRYALVTAGVARREEAVWMFQKGMQGQFRGMREREEAEWRRRRGGEVGDGAEGREGRFDSFEEYRVQASVAGSG